MVTYIGLRCGSPHFAFDLQALHVRVLCPIAACVNGTQRPRLTTNDGYCRFAFPAVCSSARMVWPNACTALADDCREQSCSFVQSRHLYAPLG